MFFIKGSFNKYDQNVTRFGHSHSLKKSWMKNFIFCVVMLVLFLTSDMRKVFHNFKQIFLIKYWFLLPKIFQVFIGLYIKESFSLNLSLKQRESTFLKNNSSLIEADAGILPNKYQILSRNADFSNFHKDFSDFLSYSKIIYDIAPLSNLSQG